MLYKWLYDVNPVLIYFNIKLYDTLYRELLNVSYTRENRLRYFDYFSFN